MTLQDAIRAIEEHADALPWHPIGTIERRHVEAWHLAELERLELRLDELIAQNAREGGK